MAARLKRTKWYIVDLDTKTVATDRAYNRMWEAIDAERAKGRFKRYTALTGARIEERIGKPWIIPDERKA